MPLANYTTFHDVRAALGVSSEELGDDVLGLQLYEDHLQADLDDISISLDPAHALLEAEPVLTAVQERFMMAARGFSTYAVAKTLTVTLPMFGPKSIEDGKARLERFNDPYKATIIAVGNEYDRWRSRLIAAFLALGETATTATTRRYVVAIPPASNPITGT